MKTSTDDRTLPRALSAVGSLPAGSISLMAKPELATKFADRHSDRDRRRRRHSRYRSDFKVIVNHLAGDLFQKIEGRSKDMSEAGIGVLLAAELENGEVTALSFFLPGSVDPWEVRAVVRHRRGYHYGFEFLSLSDAQRSTVKSYLTGLDVID
ncbi:MAG: PilZ domain-containing protein [Candidatus Sulfotelmatobacter sp.]